MDHNRWAHVRLGVSLHPTRRDDGSLCADWRLMAKAPSHEWNVRSVVAHGSERIHGVSWPPSRDDVLAILAEVLMGIRWTPEED